ncbi:rhodanese-like domain-containing protein [Candidatus Bipolaricaulota bacterium]
MKRLLMFFLFIVGAVAGTVLAAPVIEVDDTVYNVTIQAESLIAHTFTLSNAGDELLVISDVVPSCGCTTATLETYQLEPGQSVELPITIDTTGFSGLVLRVIDVFSNDPATPILTLTINIDAPEPTALTPADLAQSDFLRFFYVLIDVRTPGEFESGHLFGSVNIPVSELQENLDAWTPDLPTDVPLIVYCKVGLRSAAAAQILFDAGFENVVDLLGGMDEWIATYGDGYLFDPF